MTIEPRRFEPGFSTGYMALQQFAIERGYKLSQVKNHYTLTRIGAGGRPKPLKRAEMIERIDELRIAEGLLPIRPRRAE
jgi:hypothetical protein